MQNSRGLYNAFVRSCAKYPTRVAVRHYQEDTYQLFTYSELYGICEHLAKNLQHLQCQKSVIALITDRNVIVPCIIAAAHKCSATFMFLDTSIDIYCQTKGLNVKIIVEITKDDNNANDSIREPYKLLNILGYQIRFCNFVQHHCSESYKSLQGNSFIMMTSGSTGEPKQIEVPTSCIQPNIEDLSKLFKVKPNDVIYFSTPLTFDPSMIEMQLAIANGASLLIAPDNPDIIFPKKNVNSVNSITIWQTTPSNFFQHPEEMIQKKILSAGTTLRILALGGEPLKGVQRLSQLKHPNNKTQIFTLYGVTEMSCWACATELNLDKIRLDEDVPLGHCLSETDILIKNKPQCKTGKIFLVSNTRRCEILNKDRDENQSTSLLNCVDTGDIGEKKSDRIYFRGRRDDIIKRFGHKINLQTIENTVMMCPRIQSCSCVWLPTPHLVVVYFTSDTLSCQELSDFLRCKLNEKHWPDKVIRVDSLPTNSHGKISKSLLTKRFRSASATPLTIQSLKLVLLEELKTLFEGDFTYDDIKDKDFFSLGGTSFVAVTLCNRLSKTHDQFGKFLLPYLITPKNTIDELMEKAEAVLIMDPKKSKAKRSKRSAGRKMSAGSSGQIIVHKKPLIFQVNWSYNTGKCVDGSPTLWESVHNLYVVVGSHSGKIVVFDALYRTLKGVIKIKSRIEASVLCYSEMPMDVPCGVVGSYDGTVVCLKLESPKIKWRVNIGSMIKSKAVIVFNLIYIAAYDGAVHALDMKTGATKAKIQVSDQPISADLVTAKDQYILVAALSGVCAAIHVETKTIAWRGTVANPIFAKPVLYDDDKLVVFAEVNGEIHCQTVEKGITVWKFHGAQGNLFSSMYLQDLGKKWQFVFGCHDSKVYSIIVEEDSLPTLHWHTPVSAPVYSTPCGISDKFILAAAKTGNLYVLDSQSGGIVSGYQLPNETFSSPSVYRDLIFIGCRDDNIYGLKFIIKS